MPIELNLVQVPKSLGLSDWGDVAEVRGEDPDENSGYRKEVEKVRELPDLRRSEVGPLEEILPPEESYRFLTAKVLEEIGRMGHALRPALRSSDETVERLISALLIAGEEILAECDEDHQILLVST